MSVYVPADLDLPDKILFNLTARQVAVLAPAALGLWGLWQSLAGLVHPVLLLLASAPIAAAALALALARRDGTTLDRLVWAAIRSPRTPLAAGAPAPGAVQAALALTGMERLARVRPVPSPVDGIDPAGVIDLGAAGCAVAVAAGCVNFDLRAEGERAALCDAFARLLHSLEGHLQVSVMQRPVDLTGYLTGLDARASALGDGALQAAAQAHRAWLAGLVAGRGVLAREVTVVVTGLDAESASRAAAQVEAFLAQIGADARRLDRSELSERIRFGLDPYGTAGAAFGGWSQ
ncbi:PrgI family protein [Glycomyces sp. TRM65418]|uniref:PrgI family protein n=1 Tax=Glycomyces sp. TRM65418 TaxID=2867006 RepID=UPI001CE4F97E|nr:PrgI family protein [Glycomyces sp. TRM65418]MCC3762568.1 PrgI family protein [Glycomyces sp. TRM65418]QZD56607.1 PrgI family protein [Glycomyces sp. TRM65418]